MGPSLRGFTSSTADGAVRPRALRGSAARRLFAQHLRSRLGFVAYQNPDRIREGFALVSDVPLWPRVAEVMLAQVGAAVTVSEVRQRLEEMVWRRNRIAHEADRDPDNQPHRRVIRPNETAAAIEHLEGVAAAVVLALAG